MAVMSAEAAEGLGENFKDWLGTNIGERHWPAADLVLLLMIDPDGLKNRRKDLARTDLAILHRHSVVIGRAIDGATANAAPGQRDAPSRRKMIAPQAGVDLR